MSEATSDRLHAALRGQAIELRERNYSASAACAMLAARALTDLRHDLHDLGAFATLVTMGACAAYFFVRGWELRRVRRDREG